MYRPPQRGITGRSLRTLIVLGVLMGAGFWAYDNLLRPASVAAPTAIPSTATPVITPMRPSSAATAVPLPPVDGPDDNSALFIPSVGIYAPVITSILREGTWDVSQLGMNVGHLQGTSWLDEPGNVVMSGHVEMSDGRQGIFATLDEVQVGESIVVNHHGNEYAYTVRETFSVEPDDISVLYDQDIDTLTLITCADYDFLSDTYEQRLVVVAERVDS